MVQEKRSGKQNAKIKITLGSDRKLNAKIRIPGLVEPKTNMLVRSAHQVEFDISKIPFEQYGIDHEDIKEIEIGEPSADMLDHAIPSDHTLFINHRKDIIKKAIRHLLKQSGHFPLNHHVVMFERRSRTVKVPFTVHLHDGSEAESEARIQKVADIGQAGEADSSIKKVDGGIKFVRGHVDLFFGSKFRPRPDTSIEMAIMHETIEQTLQRLTFNHIKKATKNNPNQYKAIQQMLKQRLDLIEALTAVITNHALELKHGRSAKLPGSTPHHSEFLTLGGYVKTHGIHETLEKFKKDPNHFMKLYKKDTEGGEISLEDLDLDI